MISRLEESLKNNFFEAEIQLKELGIIEVGTECLLLAIINKNDSLLNCLYQIDYNEVVAIILKMYQKKQGSKEEKINLVLEKAYQIAIKDALPYINDEHLLYALISVKDTFAYTIIEILNINLLELEATVEDYFEFDEEYLVNLTMMAKMNKFNPFVGRKEYIDKVLRIISKKQKNNCMLIGCAGVGKSALVEAVAIELIKAKSDIIIYRLEVGVIVAGTRYRGDLEERLVEVIRKIKDRKAVLFIDEIHNITGGTKGEETINIASILKPILARSEIKCIGATTLEEYYEFIEKDKALSRRFQNLFIPEASEDETIEILNNIKHKYEKYYGIKYSSKIVNEIVQNGKYFPNRRYPDKAIDILDELGSLTIKKGVKRVYSKDIKKIVLENLGIKKDEKIKTMYLEIDNIYKTFSNDLYNRTVITKINYLGKDLSILINDIKNKFSLTDESILSIDVEILDEYVYSYILTNVLKFPIVLIVLINYCKASFWQKSRLRKLWELGYAIDSVGRKIYFHNVLFIIKNEFVSKIGYTSEQMYSDVVYDVLLDDIKI